MSLRPIVLAALALAVSGCLRALEGVPPELAPGDHFDLLIRGAVVIDGTGAPPARADLLILDDRIFWVGSLGDESHAVDRVIEAEGLVVTPGLIALAPPPWWVYQPAVADALLCAGVTTVVYPHQEGFATEAEIANWLLAVSAQSPGPNIFSARCEEPPVFEERDFTATAEPLDPRWIHRWTSRRAAALGLDALHRGRVAPGWYADLLLFDPARSDRQPAWTLVNGRIVRAQGEFTGQRAGRALRRLAPAVEEVLTGSQSPEGGEEGP